MFPPVTSDDMRRGSAVQSGLGTLDISSAFRYGVPVDVVVTGFYFPVHF